MTLCVEMSVERIFLRPRRVVGNDGLRAFCRDDAAKGIGIIRRVGHDDLCREPVDEWGGLRGVARLAGGEKKANGTTKAAHGQMDFGRQAAARAPDGLISSPPFAPLAC